MDEHAMIKWLEYDNRKLRNGQSKMFLATHMHVAIRIDFLLMGEYGPSSNTRCLVGYMQNPTKLKGAVRE